MSPFMANLIVENMYTQLDAHGNQHLLFKAIVDHSYDESAALWEEDQHHQQKTTKGWTLVVKWKDGSISWERLSDLKESLPIEVADYAIASNLCKEPAFSWWVENVVKRRKKMIGAASTKYIKSTHHISLEIPKTVKRALEIDTENGNQLWQDAISKEMEAVRVAFKILDHSKQPPPGYQ